MTDTTKHILWLDDEPFVLKAHQEALQEHGYEVTLLRDVDAALLEIDKPELPYALVIWDLSLSPGRAFINHPTEHGMYTGRFFHDHLRQNHPTVPTLLFTYFRQFIPEWLAPHKHEYAFRKLDFLPEQFAELVASLLQQKLP